MNLCVYICMYIYMFIYHINMYSHSYVPTHIHKILISTPTQTQSLSHLYINTCVYGIIPVCTCACACMCVSMCVCVCVCACVWERKNERKSEILCVCVCVCVCLFTCVFVCVCVCVCYLTLLKTPHMCTVKKKVCAVLYTYTNRETTKNPNAKGFRLGDGFFSFSVSKLA